MQVVFNQFVGDIPTNIPNVSSSEDSLIMCVKEAWLILVVEVTALNASIVKILNK